VVGAKNWWLIITVIILYYPLKPFRREICCRRQKPFCSLCKTRRGPWVLGRRKSWCETLFLRRRQRCTPSRSTPTTRRLERGPRLCKNCFETSFDGKLLSSPCGLQLTDQITFPCAAEVKMYHKSFSPLSCSQ